MKYALALIFAISLKVVLAQEANILVNQVVYDLEGPKTAILKAQSNEFEGKAFNIVDAKTSKTIFKGTIPKVSQVVDWSDSVWYNVLDFSELRKEGSFQIKIPHKGVIINSPILKIQENGLSKTTIPAILNFFKHQRADSQEELEADRNLLLFGSNKRVDLHGGWCDASGDVSKYFSHLAYTNFMSPQQIPLVTWSMMETIESIPSILEEEGIKEAFLDEALYGADYIMRSLSPEGYFYMTVFSYFDKDPSSRRVVGLLADSKTTSDYQCAWREGAGMGIAALARASMLNTSRDYSSNEYLAGAEKAYLHALANSKTYADDGKDNIIDDYCSLIASIELWKATSKPLYINNARDRAENLTERMSQLGYFISDDGNRPFWHASDAGLPIIALCRYLELEKESKFRVPVISAVKRAIDYQISITNEVENPFGYPRQTFSLNSSIQNGFFIPHENESGWWWQGENARLASIASAMILGSRLIYPGNGPYGLNEEYSLFVEKIISWILGCNPYDMSMMYGYGKNNVPYMASMYGHGSGIGGISNGITGKDGNPDGSGIDFKVEDNGNEWRWSEQWIPHTGWFLYAVTLISRNQ
ncbi:glycoside hydrolase family 9 protein [Echinicola sp. 20G]|uniref:glycoside hydrolase family 9 protein n=1 Tax=Echinicola sp. 20G TaxID=2781961 RepID=UPI001911153C|nr:glycoside hydrolase family 9 protein [Echinicola sp. 20G]